MKEKWAVVFKPSDAHQGRYLWVRDTCGSIVVFASRWQAMQWIGRSTIYDEHEHEVLYIRISKEASP
ncbi:MAG TPA: hypothetical protein PLP82_09710 [Deltaproteobacteria bacterium]|jgi:hypothetical protein|nr:hypothetical protein [Deltaproteobacteria bacterium]OQC27637.1 MAG: hypothetical protein BWX71_01258 [Deltaproteobacteria bacterium ADurb.Bin072]HRW81116.1 hypothetical protein [Desulfomonilia bacterium]NMD40728.1 hypothetical protein [Deltaproteobacteria bacterium]HNQ85985.1 hypothetical protein [Deltaproteobacteria bacterium]